MPDSTLSLAIQEAYASALSDAVLYHTLEIWHPDFTVPIRVVRDHADLTARIEAGAPRDAGTMQTFVAFAFDLVPPDVSTSAVPQCIIELDNVGRDIIGPIEASLGSAEPITVIYRAYLSGNLTIGPENDPPLALTILAISANVFRIRATCGFGDMANRRFPALDYTASVFPGLIPQ
jgi:hypothetical protein